MVSMFKNCLRSVAYLAIGALTLALAQSANAQSCRGGGGGGGMGYSRGGMGGGYSGGGYMGGPGQSNGMTGGYQGQSTNSTGSQNSNPQQAQSSSTIERVNNPSTVLAYEGDLNLTSKQVQLLNKMASSGKLHAAFILTPAQRKQLAALVGTVRKSGSAGTSRSPSVAASSIAASP